MELNKQDLELMNSFYNERHIGKRTRYGYNNAFSVYVKYSKMHLQELLAEADAEEDKGIRWKKRKLKKRLVGFRNYLQEHYNYSTLKVQFGRIKTFYLHYEIEIGTLPKLNQKAVIKTEPITYDDIPDKDTLTGCIKHSEPLFKALILFMTSSGCARRETLNLTIDDFIEATKEYHNSDNINEVIVTLLNQDNVIPTFRIRRQKTNKYYHTFCSPEAVKAICEYLIVSGRNFKKGYNKHLLFKTNLDALNNHFTKLNDKLNLGKAGNYNRIRTHMFRKFHASRLYNDGLNIEIIDALQGRSKDNTHNAYFKESPEKLKELYIEHMDAVRVKL